MSDTTNAGAGAPPAPPQLAVAAQYIKDLSFENPNAPAALRGPNGQPQVQVNVDVQARGVGQDSYEVMLRANIEAKQGEQTAFILELLYGGVFILRNIPPEHLEAVCLVECPRLLFPFARRIIADATRDGGFPPLMLDPIDFAALYLQGKQRQAQTQASPVGTA